MASRDEDECITIDLDFCLQGVRLLLPLILCAIVIEAD